MDRNYCLLVFIVNMSFSDTESWKMLFTWKTIDVQEKGGRVLSTNTCAHNILYYSHKIGILFPQHIILFPPHIILFPQTLVHDLWQAHTNGAWLSKFCGSCESSCLCKHRTTDNGQIQYKRGPESRKYRALLCIYIYIYFCSSLEGIWTHTIVTLQHLSPSLTSSALDHSTTSTP
jgi:hypothetical protein